MTEPVNIAVPSPDFLRPQVRALVGVEYIIDFYDLTYEEARDVGRWIVNCAEQMIADRERDE